jgi:hypothetical protein
MKKIEILEKKKLLNFQKYLNTCDKIKNQEKISLSTLQRVLRASSKTTLLNDVILTYRLKQTSVSVSITWIPKTEIFPHYFIVKLSDKPNLNIQLSALNLKELMYKINHSYKFLQC